MGNFGQFLLLGKILGARADAKEAAKDAKAAYKLENQIAKDKVKIQAMKDTLTKAQADVKKLRRATPAVLQKIAYLDNQLQKALSMLQRQEREYHARTAKLRFYNILLPIAAVGGIAFLIGSTIWLTRWKDKQIAKEHGRVS